ncbi:MAG: hypothetical protein FJ272_07185, partial [Planctomycetes bacterium]|nr:hypothetical protein [Planctomycetota bacterium]
MVKAALLIWSSLAAGLVVANAAAAGFRETEEHLLLAGDTCDLLLRTQNGALVRVVDKRTGQAVCVGESVGGAEPTKPVAPQKGGVAQSAAADSLPSPGQAGMPALRAGGAALWRLGFQDGTWLAASEFSAASEQKRFSYRWEQESLRLDFKSSEVSVTVTLTPSANGVDFRAEVANPSKVALTLDFPPPLEFDVAALKRFYFPDDLGVAFKKAFYLPQSAERPAGWRTAPIGPQGLTTLLGHGCKMLAVDEPPCRVELTKEGREWLGQEFERRFGRADAIVNRPPDVGAAAAPAAPDVALLTSKNGVYVPGYRLGGSGWFFRIGGKVTREDAQLVTAVVTRTCEHLWSQAGTKTARTIGLLDLLNGPRTGSWAATDLDEWKAALQALRPVRQGSLKLELITSVSGLRDALTARKADFFAIVNPYGEGLPGVKEGDWRETIEAIRGYVKAGGVWWETGGYSFHHQMLPQLSLTISRPYPSLFADFAFLDSDAGTLAVYGIQPDVERQPWTKRNAFVPATLATGASASGRGHFKRSFNTYVAPGQTWRSPVVRLEVGAKLGDAIGRYVSENRFERRLEDKMKPELLDKFKRSVLLHYNGANFVEEREGLAQMPSPAIIHQSGYMLGGFDKQYPDFFPPNPKRGTLAELRAVYDRAHELGLLMMPYDNPTWWCDEPPSPSLEKHGKVALALDLSGKQYIERYGWGKKPNWGYGLTFAHPVAREIRQRNVRLFTTEAVTSDLLFQDQVGARSWRYDLNPASATPYGHIEGLIDIAREDSQVVPLSTECGQDRLINYESQFCGLTWHLTLFGSRMPWTRFYREQWPDDAWEFYPLALFMAHDKVAFTHHDLGQSITDKASLSLSLGIGYQMIYRTGAKPSAESLRWIHWLDAIQKRVASRYMGKRLTDFTYLAPGVFRSTFEDVAITVNQHDEPYQAAEGRVIAPQGFLAESTTGDLLAGVFGELNGKRYP